MVKLEKLPMELLLLLLGRRGELVTREVIIARLWGEDVFVDTEQGINTAIRKIRQALRDDPEQPRFLQTVVGKGYRFIAPVTDVGASDHNAQRKPGAIVRESGADSDLASRPTGL